MSIVSIYILNMTYTYLCVNWVHEVNTMAWTLQP